MSVTPVFPSVILMVAIGGMGGELVGLGSPEHGLCTSVSITRSWGGRWDWLQRPFLPERAAGTDRVLRRCAVREESAPASIPQQAARGGVTMFLVLFDMTFSAIEVILLLCFIVRGSHSTSIEGIAKVA